MSNKLYDILAIIGRLILPALGTLYFAIAKIWNLPLQAEVLLPARFTMGLMS